MFSASLSGPFAKLSSLISEVDERAAAARRVFTRRVADAFLKTIRARIPKGKVPEWDKYRDSLMVVEEDPPKAANETLVAVVGSGPKEKIGNRSPATTVIWVRPKATRCSPLTALLFEHGPWTRDTLPAVPPKDARVSYAEVGEREAGGVARRARAAARRIGPLLQRAGVARKPSPEDVGKTEAAQDLVLLALRMEFGISGSPEVVHWRSSLRDLEREIGKIADAEPSILSFVTDADCRAWKKKPEKIATLDRGVAVAYADFSKKVRG